MEDSNYLQNNEQKIELEDQFILRLPPAQAEIISNALKHAKSKKFKKYLSINFNLDKKDIHTGTVKVKKQQLHAKLVDLPCIVESYKTIDDGVHLFKTADISQMLICQKEEFKNEEENFDNNSKLKNKKFAYPHGITPPLKNVRKQRFRKVLKNKEDLEEVAEIEKEVLWLLRADNEAVSTKFEIHCEEPNIKTVSERTIFGEIISDIESCDENDSSLTSEKTSSSELIETNKNFTGELNDTIS